MGWPWKILCNIVISLEREGGAGGLPDLICKRWPRLGWRDRREDLQETRHWCPANISLYFTASQVKYRNIEYCRLARREGRKIRRTQRKKKWCSNSHPVRLNYIKLRNFYNSPPLCYHSSHCPDWHRREWFSQNSTLLSPRPLPCTHLLALSQVSPCMNVKFSTNVNLQSVSQTVSLQQYGRLLLLEISNSQV